MLYRIVKSVIIWPSAVILDFNDTKALTTLQECFSYILLETIVGDIFYLISWHSLIQLQLSLEANIYVIFCGYVIITWIFPCHYIHVYCNNSKCSLYKL